MSRLQNAFVNKAAIPKNIKCGPTNRHFWKDVSDSMKAAAGHTGSLEKAPQYRENLTPYLYRRVQIVSTTGWSVIGQTGNRVRLCLNDAMLIFVGESKAKRHAARNQDQKAVRVPTGHMNIFVDETWMHFVDPQPDEDLLVNGILYEYQNRHGMRNIAVLPVIVTPIKGHHENF